MPYNAVLRSRGSLILFGYFLCSTYIFGRFDLSRDFLGYSPGGGGGRYSHTLPIRVCAAQQGRDFEAPDLEGDIHFRGVF